MRPPTRNRRLAYAVVGVVSAGLLASGLSTAWAATNLAGGATATGSAPCRASESPAKAINGSASQGLGDKFCSAAAKPFLQLDLKTAQSIGEFVVQHASRGKERTSLNTRDFTISVSADGQAFTTLVTVTGNTAARTTHPVAPTTARFVRIDVTTPTQTADRAARIYEFEVYAAPTPAPSSASPSTAAPTTATPTTAAPTTAAPSPTTVTPTTAGPTTGTPPAGCHADAPATIIDYISDHKDAMTRVACNADVAVYFDNDLRNLPAAGTTWVTPFVTDVWRYMKDSYGECVVERQLPAPIGPNCTRFGDPKPALAFFHQGKHGGGTVANRFDAFSGFRTTLDVGTNGWRESDGILHDMIVHEACHQIEGASQGVHESPAFPIWGDSKWAEFCLLDFYTNTGRTADAQRVLNLFLNQSDNLPAGASNVHWLRDWFKPLWDEAGKKPNVMERYFGLLSQHFPKRAANGGKNLTYSRRMNVGEYVHFTSAAAGKDLSGRAAQVFNTGFKRAEFDKARQDFPDLKY
jgi:hypothetical protein